jgi:DHA1 family solute carrier family 18 vesicular amine transporter 1/2
MTLAQGSQDRSAGPAASDSKAVIWVIAFSLLLDYFLYALLFPVLPHSPAKLQGEGQFALLYGAYAMSVLLVTPLFGYLGDRFGSRSILLCGVALAACAIALFGLAPNFPLVLVAKICQGSASAALWTSGLALVASNYVVKRVEMLGFAFAGGTFGSVTGPIAGGFLFNAGGYKLPFLVTGVLLGIEAVLILLFLRSSGTSSNERVDYRSLMLNKSLMVPAVAIALAAFSVGIVEPLLPVRLERFGTSSMAVGMIFTVSTLVYGLSAPLVGYVSKRMSIQRVMVLGTIGMAATLPLLAIFRGAILVGFSLSLINVAYAFMINPASAELGNVVDRAGMSCYSAVYAVYNVFYSVGMLATAGLASAAGRLLSFWVVLLCCSAVLLLCIPLLTMANAPRKAVPAEAGG